MARSDTAKISYDEMSAFCRQLAMLIEGGLTLEDAAESIRSANEGGRLKAHFGRLAESVRESGVLSSALSKDEIWPAYLIEMVIVGENTGRLEEILLSLAEHYEREARTRRAVHNAFAYPMVLGSMIFVIIVIMLTLVMPVFTHILEGMGLTAGGVSGGLFQTGRVLGWTVLFLVGAFMASGVSSLLLMKTGAKTRVIYLLTKLFPSVRRTASSLESARVINVVSVMLKSGFSSDRALEAAARNAGNENVKEKLKNAYSVSWENISMADALSSAIKLNDVEISMLRMAESMGKAETALDKIAKDLEERAEEALENFLGVIEPTLITVLAVVVGVMLLSVMLPMAGILAGVI